MKLKLFIQNPSLRLHYIDPIKEHNAKTEKEFPPAGFGLFCPERITIYEESTTNLELDIACAAYIGETPCPLYMYPLRSIAKTPLRMSNSVGIIESSNRDTLNVFVDNISSQPYVIPPGASLFQLCAPTLEPIYIELVESISELKYAASASDSCARYTS